MIVIASLLFLLATAALIWAYRRYKNKKQLNGVANRNHGDDEKVPVLTPNKNESNIAVATSSPAAAIPTGKFIFILTGIMSQITYVFFIFS